MSTIAARTKKANATRQALLNAALRIISRKGYSNATIDAIAKEAGVSKGLAYYHFKSKAEMATGILENGVSNLVHEFDAIANAASSAEDALMGMLDKFVDMAVSNREFMRFFLNELWRDERAWSEGLREVEQELVDVISKQFRRGQDEGVVSKNVDPEFISVSSIGMVLTTATYYFDVHSGTLDKEAYSKRILSFVRAAAASH